MRKAVNQSQAQRLADRLRQQIERSRLPDGTLFMTEADVATQFGVSRTVAREAVAQLRAIGLLEGRQRKGLIVRRPNPVQLFSTTLPALADSKEDLEELAKLRYVLELGAIELAVKNATEAQIQRLTALAEEIREAFKHPRKMGNEKRLDITFHSLLLEMTGSKFVAEMQRVLVEFFGKITPIVHLDSATAERIAWEHSELADAIAARDLERARAMIRMQVSRYLT